MKISAHPLFVFAVCMLASIAVLNQMVIQGTSEIESCVTAVTLTIITIVATFSQVKTEEELCPVPEN